MQEVELLAQYPSNNKQRFDQQDQVGKVFNQLLDTPLELDRSNHPNFEAKVAQGGTQVVLNRDGLGLQQLAVSQQHAQLLLRGVFTLTGR
jgi:hypothetical protein